MLLFTTVPSYSFRFFGVDVSGTLDEVTENLKSIGFSPVMVTPKTGKFAGKEIIFGNDSIRVLRGNLLGFTVNLDLTTDNKSQVDGVRIDYKKSDLKSKNQFAGDLFNYLCEKYAEPKPLIIKKVLDKNELSEFQKAYEGNAPDVLGIWEFKNMMITFQIYFSTGAVTCSYSNKNTQE